MRTNSILALAITTLLAVLGVGIFAPQAKLHGQTAAATPVFTVAGVGGGNGAAIVDQTTGAVTYCTAFVDIGVNNAVPNDGCIMAGRITPGIGTASLSIAAGQSAFFVVNNQTGNILQCASIDSISGGNRGNPEGACVSLGNAASVLPSSGLGFSSYRR